MSKEKGMIRIYVVYNYRAFRSRNLGQVVSRAIRDGNIKIRGE